MICSQQVCTHLCMCVFFLPRRIGIQVSFSISTVQQNSVSFIHWSTSTVGWQRTRCHWRFLGHWYLLYIYIYIYARVLTRTVPSIYVRLLTRIMNYICEAFHTLSAMVLGWDIDARRFNPCIRLRGSESIMSIAGYAQLKKTRQRMLDNLRVTTNAVEKQIKRQEHCSRLNIKKVLHFCRGILIFKVYNTIYIYLFIYL